MITRVGPDSLLIDVVFENGGKKITSPIILDTGASGPVTAYIDSKFAAKLGIKAGSPFPVAGVGGGTLGWTGTIDRMSITDNPDCTLDNQQVVILDLGVAFRIQGAGLLGLEFIKRAKMALEFTDEPGYGDRVKIGCLGKPQKVVNIRYPGNPGAALLVPGLIQLGAILGFSVLSIYLVITSLNPD
jgi:hypothetical protein